MKATKVLKILKWVAIGLCAAAVLIFALGWLVMWLWNWLMPDIFGLKEITVYQAWGLLVLAHLLLGAGHSSSHNHSHHSEHGGSSAQPAPAAPAPAQPPEPPGSFRQQVREKLRPPDATS